MPSTMNSTLKNIAARAKAHHESVNAAYETFYTGGVSPRPSMTQTRNNSAVSQQSNGSSSPSGMGKAWKAVKKAAKEHHESVNAAYSTYYGAGASRKMSADYNEL